MANQGSFLEAFQKIPLADGPAVVQYEYITLPQSCKSFTSFLKMTPKPVQNLNRTLNVATLPKVIKHQYTCVSELGNSFPQ
jgi:hypothetical protein